MDSKKIAVDFLKLIIDGKIDEAYNKFPNKKIKIIEMWDCWQIIPKYLMNKDGAF